MKPLLLTLLLIPFACFGQKQLKTEKYAGTYSWGTSPECGTGQFILYPETDSTILFWIDVCRGAPSYSLGQLYLRMKFVNGKGIYSTKQFAYDDSLGCKWLVTIKNKILTIKTLDKGYECGFGNGVTADGTYKLQNGKKPKFFIDGHGTKVFFASSAFINYLKLKL